MVETELDELEILRPRRAHFHWVFPLFFKPRATLEKVAAHEKPAWFTPILILSLLAILFVMVSGPVRAMEAQANIEPPPDFEWWDPATQEEWFASQATRSGPLLIYVLPAVGALAGVWISWFLLGSILHLALTMAGSRGSYTAVLNLTAWASLPFAVRTLVRTIALLTSQRLITAPGLSGFIAADAEGAGAFLAPLLARVDIYLIWQIVLLMIGVLPLTGLKRGKAWTVVIIAVILVVILLAVPGFISLRFSGLNITRMF